MIICLQQKPVSAKTRLKLHYPPPSTPAPPVLATQFKTFQNLKIIIHAQSKLVSGKKVQTTVDIIQ